MSRILRYPPSRPTARHTCACTGRIEYEQGDVVDLSVAGSDARIVRCPVCGVSTPAQDLLWVAQDAPGSEVPRV